MRKVPAESAWTLQSSVPGAAAGNEYRTTASETYKNVKAVPRMASMSGTAAPVEACDRTEHRYFSQKKKSLKASNTVRVGTMLRYVRIDWQALPWEASGRSSSDQKSTATC